MTYFGIDVGCNPLRTTACLVLVLLATTAQAQTLYRVVGPDGKVTYTDRPPADPKSATQLKVAPAPYSTVPESATKQNAATAQGRQTPANESSSPATLFYATWCGYCEQARSYLQAKGISVREVDIDSADGAREYATAGGRRGIPLLIAGSKRQQGFSAGAYDRFFGAK